MKKSPYLYSRLSSLIMMVLLLVLVVDRLPVAAESFDYSRYQQFLDRYLTEDKEINEFKLNVVDYAGIFKVRDKPNSLYRQALKKLAEFDPHKISDRDEQIAFWINAYNIGAIKMIIDHYPVDSIRSRKISFMKNPWDKKVLKVGDETYSLTRIEHEILLGELKIPMAHFAIVCASLSCPELSPKAYQARSLQKDLTSQAQRFLRDPIKGLKIDKRQKTIYFSKIFKFDQKTFPNGAKDAVKLIAPLLAKADSDYLLGGDYRIKYLKYNWSINDLGRVN